MVVFYGFGYREYWQTVAGTNFSFDQRGFYFANDGGTTFFIVKHPVAKGVTNAYFHMVGRTVGEWTST